MVIQVTSKALNFSPWLRAPTTLETSRHRYLAFIFFCTPPVLVRLLCTSNSKYFQLGKAYWALAFKMYYCYEAAVEVKEHSTRKYDISVRNLFLVISSEPAWSACKELYFYHNVCLATRQKKNQKRCKFKICFTELQCSSTF